MLRGGASASGRAGTRVSSPGGGYFGSGGRLMSSGSTGSSSAVSGPGAVEGWAFAAGKTVLTGGCGPRFAGTDRGRVPSDGACVAVAETGMAEASALGALAAP